MAPPARQHGDVALDQVAVVDRALEGAELVAVHQLAGPACRPRPKASRRCPPCPRPLRELGRIHGEPAQVVDLDLEDRGAAHERAHGASIANAGGAPTWLGPGRCRPSGLLQRGAAARALPRGPAGFDRDGFRLRHQRREMGRPQGVGEHPRQGDVAACCRPGWRGPFALLLQQLGLHLGDEATCSRCAGYLSLSALQEGAPRPGRQRPPGWSG